MKDDNSSYVYITCNTTNAGLGHFFAGLKLVTNQAVENPDQDIVWIVGRNSNVDDANFDGLPQNLIIYKYDHQFVGLRNSAELIPTIEDAKALVIYPQLDYPQHLGEELESMLGAVAFRETVEKKVFITYEYDRMSLEDLKNSRLNSRSNIQKSLLKYVPLNHCLISGIGESSLGVVKKESVSSKQPVDNIEYLQALLREGAMTTCGYFNGRSFHATNGITEDVFLILSTRLALHRGEKHLDVVINTKSILMDTNNLPYNNFFRYLEKAKLIDNVVVHVIDPDYTEDYAPISAEKFTYADHKNDVIANKGQEDPSDKLIIRIIHVKHLASQRWIQLMEKSTLVSATGDQSCVEAWQFANAHIYECVSWKEIFYKAYLDKAKSLGYSNITNFYESLEQILDGLSRTGHVRVGINTLLKEEMENLIVHFIERFSDFSSECKKLSEYLLEHNNLVKKLPSEITKILLIDKIIAEPQQPLTYRPLEEAEKQKRKQECSEEEDTDNSKKRKVESP